MFSFSLRSPITAALAGALALVFGAGAAECPDLAIDYQTISGTEIHETCGFGNVSLGPDLVLTSTADLTVRSHTTQLFNGVEAYSGARLQIGINDIMVSLPGGVPLEMVWIPAGTFTMGSPTDEPGRRSNEVQHQVTLTSYYMGETEVTVGQWQALMGNDPSSSACAGADCPLENVNWYEAAAFANAVSDHVGLARCYTLSGCTNSPGNDMECTSVSSVGPSCSGYRLPTEAEWEKAARGEETAKFSLGQRRNVTDCLPPVRRRVRPLETTWCTARTIQGAHGLWAARGWRTAMVCTTCMETCGNGRRTGSAVMTRGQRPIRQGLHQARTGSAAAVVGATARSTAGRRSVTGFRRAFATAPWASALPGHHDPLSLEPLDSWFANEGTTMTEQLSAGPRSGSRSLGLRFAFKRRTHRGVKGGFPPGGRRENFEVAGCRSA